MIGRNIHETDRGLDIEFTKRVTHQRLSQSEDLRGWALNKFRPDWLSLLSVWLGSAFSGGFFLQVAWLLQPIEPALWAFIRWGVFFAPWICTFYAVTIMVLILKNKLQWSAAANLPTVMAIAFGLAFTWFLHGI